MIKIIVNPVAGNGKVGSNWSGIKQILDRILEEYSFEFTTGPLTAVELTRKALRDGYQTLVSIGGDGTVNEVVNGFFDNEKMINPEAALGVISMGTGRDLIKTLGLPKELEACVKLIKRRTLFPCDIGKVSFVDFKEHPQKRYFINVADIGFGGEIVERVNRHSKALGGFLSFLSAFWICLFQYQNKPVRIKVDEIFDEERIVNSVTVANGQYFGGGMWIAPEARLDDGWFEVVIVGDINRNDVLGNIAKLYKGTLASHKKVQYLKGKRITMESAERVLLDVDGEQPGILPTTFEILPKALNCIV